MKDIGFIVAIKGIGNVLNQMWEFCVNAWEVITNPTQIFSGALDLSYWILLIVSIICLILTMSGCKKTKNGAAISIIIYVILQCFASILI